MTGPSSNADEIDLIDEETPSTDDSRSAIAFSALMLVAGVVFFVGTLSMSSQAATWPRVLSVPLIVMAAAQLALSLRSRMRSLPAATANDPARHTGNRRRALTAIWLAVYCVASQWVGFGPALLVLTPAYMWLFGFRRPLWIAVITIMFAAGLTFVFEVVANVPMWSARL